MPAYEVKFVVELAGLTDGVVDALGDSEDVLCGGTGYGDGFVVITAPGVNGGEAIARGRGTLERAGLRVLDVQRDLVTGPAIAARTGQTRQAVHLWTTGRRRAGFPAPFDPVNGLWLWGEVQRWALANGIAVEDADVAYPSRADHDRASLELAQARREVTPLSA